MQTSYHLSTWVGLFAKKFNMLQIRDINLCYIYTLHTPKLPNFLWDQRNCSCGKVLHLLQGKCFKNQELYKTIWYIFVYIYTITQTIVYMIFDLDFWFKIWAVNQVMGYLYPPISRQFFYRFEFSSWESKAKTCQSAWALVKVRKYN